MKLLQISRKHILRTIHMAWVALFIAASASHAGAAPTSSAEFTISGTSVSGAGTNTTTAFFTDPTTPSPNAYVVTIQPQALLGNTTSAVLTFDNGTVTTSSSSSLSGADNAVVILSTGTVTNAGTIISTNHTAVKIGSAGTIATDSGIVNNSGAITVTGGTGSGVSISGTATVNNSGTISGINSGVFVLTAAGQSDYVVNSGAIHGNTGSAIYIQGDATVINSSTGTLTTNQISTVDVAGIGMVTNAGTITSLAFDGIRVNGPGSVVTNTGTITASGTGVYMGADNSTFTSSGGTITSGGNVVYLAGQNSTVSILGRTNLTGLLNGNSGTGNTLNLEIVGMTPAEAAAANAQTGVATGTFTVGANTYAWQNFANVNITAAALENVVDSGLTEVATKIDNNALSAAFDPFYAAAAVNPEAATNALVGRAFDNAFSTIGLGTATTFVDTADARAYDLRISPGGFDLSGLNVRSDSLIASLGDTSSRLSRMAGPSAIGGTMQSDSASHLIVDSPDELRWGAWVAGTVTFADASTTATDTGYNATTGSPTIGVDYRVSHNLALGALINYTTTGADFGDGSSMDVQTGSIGVYGTWTDGPWYVNGLAAGGLSTYDNKRKTLDGNTATSSPDGSQVVVALSTGHDFKITSQLRVSPEVGLQYTHLTENSFNESGAGAFDLNVAQQDVDSLRTRLGFRVSGEYKWNSIKLGYQGHVMWYHECLDDSRGVSTSLSGASALGSFNVKTDDPERDFALLGIGISATPEAFDEALTFFISYDAQVGQDNYLAHTINSGVRYMF